MRYFVISSILILFSACTQQSSNTTPVKLFGEAQGTYYSIQYFDDEQRDFQYEIDSILKAFDQSVSLWVPNSILSRVNNNDSSVELDEFFIDNFALAQDVAKQTDGNFDMTVGSLVRAWGFGFDAEKKVDEKIIDSILAFTGYQKVSFIDDKLVKEDIRTTFDFNAVAQGYSVDLICAYLSNKDIENYLVDIGGEVRGNGHKPDGSKWKVGIEKPAQNKSDQRNLKAIVDVADLAIATSGNYRKFYEEDGIRYSHTINPKTGYPVQHSLLSATVMAENAALADAFATAFMVMGLEQSKSFLSVNTGLEAFFIFSDENGENQTYATPGFQQQISKSFE